MSMLLTAVYALVFLALCVLVVRFLGRRGPFGSSVGVLALAWLFFYVVFPGVRVGSSFTIPGIAMVATGAEAPLVVPSFAFWSYMVLVVVGILAVVSASDATLNDFVSPITAFLRGKATDKAKSKAAGWKTKAPRVALLYVAVPALCGWLGFNAYRPRTAAPAEGRQAHPSIGYDEKLTNPLRTPTREMLQEYAEDNDLGGLGADELRQSFDDAMVHEGRHLYAKNCAPCHGGKADGAGIMARALRLSPANFTDPGTIATLVEGYAFKRVQAGGIGLPGAGAPWDSAMPRWKGELTDDEIFKVLLAEYDLAGVSPRVPEKLE